MPDGLSVQNRGNIKTPDDHSNIIPWCSNLWGGGVEWVKFFNNKKPYSTGNNFSFLLHNHLLFHHSKICTVWIPNDSVMILCIISLSFRVWAIFWTCQDQNWSPKQILGFLRPDRQSEQIWLFGLMLAKVQTFWRDIFEILSVHQSQIFENLHLASPPIFGALGAWPHFVLGKSLIKSWKESKYLQNVVMAPVKPT